MNNGWNKVIQHDALQPFPLPDSVIDVVITSPPYWGLRDYGVDGQIGLEKHPQEYINHLVKVAKEIKRVLKKSGSFYLNLGDTYCGSGMGTWDVPDDYKSKQVYYMGKGKSVSAKVKNDGGWLQPKQLMLIPSRTAIALQDDGWILRNDIIWHKPNPMPTSVKDRLNNTFEHVFHFVKNRKYFYNLDAIRVPHKSIDDLNKRKNKFWSLDIAIGGSGKQNVGRCREEFYSKDGKNPGDVVCPSSWGVDKNQEYHGDGKHNPKGQSPSDLKKSIIESFKDNPKGKNPGDFWDICTQPFTSYNQELEHFAVFPEELIEKPLKASCPKDGVVLDCFCGRGTVGRVAKNLGLNYVLFDIKPEYVELARLYVGGQKMKLIKNQKKLEG